MTHHQATEPGKPGKWDPVGLWGQLGTHGSCRVSDAKDRPGTGHCRGLTDRQLTVTPVRTQCHQERGREG